MIGLLGAPMGVAYHLVSALAQSLAPLTGGLATTAAIVVFTLAVRLLLLPLSYYALRGQARMSAVLPQAQDLQKRYAKQPDKLQAELGALYRREGTGMLAGCLPLLLQLPFFSIMYRLFLSRTVDGAPNGLLSRDLLGTPLGSHWLTGAGPLSGQGLVFLGVFALLAVVAGLAARSARQSAMPGRPGQPAGQQGGALGALGAVLPYATLVIAALVPLAAGIYLLTTTTWTVAERAVLRRRILPSGQPESGPGQPGPAKPGPGKPQPGQPGPAKPGSGPGPGQPGPAKPGPGKPQPGQPGPAKPGSGPGPGQPGPGKAGPAVA
jgi:YidC/Oxa1 family membrane protein insertase